MKTKVNNCGKYECTHCNYEGQCVLSCISIDRDGKCVLFKKSNTKTSEPRYNPMDEHTNMC